MPTLKFSKQENKFINDDQWVKMKKADKVLKYLRSQKDNKSIKVSDVTKALNLSKKEVRTAIKELNSRSGIKILQY